MFSLMRGLWFDVEERYNTTKSGAKLPFPTLWFDVEERYNTTDEDLDEAVSSCGLM